jgi:hypothetical protein
VKEKWAANERGVLVSDQGRVWGTDGEMESWTNNDGYRLVHLNGRLVYVHRLVLETWRGPCPPGREARHLDGDASNNRLTNLRWGTHAENTWDVIRHGHHPGLNATQCRWGHDFTPQNTYRGSDGKRRCRACQRVRDASRARNSKRAHA